MQQRRWVEYLQEFNFEITYKLERENQSADALKRKVQVLTIFIISNPMLVDIQKALSKDPYFSAIMSNYPNQVAQEIFKD